MQLTCACPGCERTITLEVSAQAPLITCPQCSQEMTPPEGAWEGGRLKHCLVCPNGELFLRKDFPQRLGVTIVAVGLIGSSIAWYSYNIFLTFGILFLTALADMILFLFMKETLICYRCSAEYRGLDEQDRQAHAGFELAVHERYRQQEARLREAAAAQQPPAPSVPSAK